MEDVVFHRPIAAGCQASRTAASEMPAFRLRRMILTR